VLVVVGGLDIIGPAGDRERLGSSFFSPSIALRTMSFGSPSFAASSKRMASTLALTRCAAICAPMTPAPRTAAFRTMKGNGPTFLVLDPCKVRLSVPEEVRSRTADECLPPSSVVRQKLCVYECSKRRSRRHSYQPPVKACSVARVWSIGVLLTNRCE